MPSIYAIGCSCVLHFVLRTSFIIHQTKDVASESTDVAAYVIYLSMMELLYNANIIPQHWQHLPACIKFVVELMFTVFLGEIFLSIIWLNLELYSSELLKRLINSAVLRSIALNFGMIMFSGTIALITGMITDRNAKLMRMLRRVRYF